MVSSGKKKILVSVDGSNESAATVQYVANTMSPADTQVVLFHAFSRIPESFWDVAREPELDVWMNKMKAMEQEHEQKVQAFMQNARQELLDRNFREENIIINVQDRKVGIARDIVAEAQKGYNLLMMGRKGVSGLEGVTVGSVANKVIGAVNRLPICVVTGRPSFEKMIVAIDGSEGSTKAVDFICSDLRNNHRKVILFHAMRKLGFPEAAQKSESPFAKIEQKIWDDARALIKPCMEDAKTKLVKAGFAKDEIKVKIVTGVDSRAGALIAEANTSGCGSIVVGRKGVSQVEEFHIGRVCHKVIQKAENMAIWLVP
jgi:nucleotide-binding universal stress UspA family protein